MSLLVNLLIATVAVYILFFVPLGQWKRLERHFCLKADLGKSVNIRRFSSVYLEGVQLNGLVSVFVYLIRNRFLPWGGKHVKLSCFCAHGGGLLRWRERL
jgi:hypothetical protein